ncbi:hypothetical protein PENSPDRAFT_668962 [Peniophora sp. CONT]|nr:hypothetical protein PENSPDRAFT_668962 [Peniophora sp. CONT]
MDNDPPQPESPGSPRTGWRTVGVLSQPPAFETVHELSTVGVRETSSTIEPWPVTVSEAGWLASGIGRLRSGRMLNLDIISLILFFLVPPADHIPSHGGWPYLRPSYVCWVADAMCVSRAWYSCALRNFEMWGALLASVWHSSTWVMVSRRAMAAPKRLFYLNKFFFGTLDAFIDGATAIYADWSSRFRFWGTLLQGRQLDNLEVLYVRPDYKDADDRDEPSDPHQAFPSPAHPLNTPCLRRAAISSPAVFLSDVLEHLVLSNFSATQLVDAFAPLTSLRHLEIHKPRVGDGIDWTRTLARGSWDQLVVLRIWGYEGKNYRLASDSSPVSMPVVETLDLAGALLLHAPCAREAQFRHILLPDVIRMLRGTPQMAALEIRSLLGNTWYDFNEGLPSVPLHLPALVTLTLTNEIQNGTRELLRSLRAPGLRAVSMRCNASPPYNRLALQYAAGILDAALPGDLNTVRQALRDANHAFWIAGYTHLSSVLLQEVAPVGIWNDDVLLPAWNALLIMTHAALLMRDMATAVYNEGQAPHAGYYLHDAVMAALGTMALDAAHLKGVRMCIRSEHYAAEFEVEVARLCDGRARKIRCAMISPSTTMPTPLEPWNRPDSVAFGSARILHGLSVLPVEEMFVINRDRGPFWSLRDSHDDVAELSCALARYSFVRTLVVEIDGSYAEDGLLQALSDARALPALRHISVCDRSPPHYALPVGHPYTFDGWWEALEQALRQRRDSGAPVHSLIVDGRFCLRRGWQDRVRGLVDVPSLEEAPMSDSESAAPSNTAAPNGSSAECETEHRVFFGAELCGEQYSSVSRIMASRLQALHGEGASVACEACAPYERVYTYDTVCKWVQSYGQAQRRVKSESEVCIGEVAPASMR